VGNIPAIEAPILEELHPTNEDGIGDSSSPNLTKWRQLSAKASEGAFSAIENPQKESLNMNSLLVEQDREDARHRFMLEMDAKKHREMLELKARSLSLGCTVFMFKPTHQVASLVLSKNLVTFSCSWKTFI
jgi:hypothetical protein